MNVVIVIDGGGYWMWDVIINVSIRRGCGLTVVVVGRWR